VRSALRVPGFVRLATTYTLNEVCDWLASIALAVLVYDRTHDALAMTALFIAGKLVPAFVANGLTARLEGAPVNRVLPGLYVVEAATFGVLALTVDGLSLVLVLALSLVFGTVAIAGRAVTRATTVAVLRPHERLREGNALLNVAFSIAAAVGPAVGGALVAVAGAGTALGASSAIFLVMAGVLCASTLPHGEISRAPWLARLRDGLEYVGRHPVLRPVIALEAVLLVLFTTITPIEVVYAKQSLHAGDTGFGLLLATWGLGTVLGSAVFARERRRPVVVLAIAATLAVAAGYGGMAVAPSLAVACAFSAVGGIGNGVQWVAVLTAIQEAVETAYVTRVSGLIESLGAAVPGIGFILGGALTALASPRTAYAVSGIAIAVVVLVAATAWRSLCPTPDGAPA
jgi:MFS family permease